MTQPFFTPTERSRALRYQTPAYEFTCEYQDLSKPLYVTPRRPDYANHDPALVAEAVADFTAWWVGEIHPRLNGTTGLGGVQWVFTSYVPDNQRQLTRWGPELKPTTSLPLAA